MSRPRKCSEELRERATGGARRLRRCNDVDADSRRLRHAVQAEAGRSSLVEAWTGCGNVQSQSATRWLVSKRRRGELTARHVDRGGFGRAGVDLEPSTCSRWRSGRDPSNQIGQPQLTQHLGEGDAADPGLRASEATSEPIASAINRCSGGSSV